MGLMDDVLAADSEAFVDVDGSFGESVTYTPRGGSARTISVVVDRNPEVEAVIVIEARNHATLGISPTETGFIGGTVSVPMRVGETAVDFDVEQPNPIEQDAGIVRIALNRMR